MNWPALEAKSSEFLVDHGKLDHWLPASPMKTLSWIATGASNQEIANKLVDSRQLHCKHLNSR
jgi:hypothetical protein